MKKKFLSRIARRKDSAPAKPDEGHEIPPPTAIDPGVPYSAEDTEGKAYDSHMELELLAADEPPRTDLTNSVDARESDPAPALESLTAPVPGEPPDSTAQSRAPEPPEGYGTDLEALAVADSIESPSPTEPPREDEEAAAPMAEMAVEPPDFEPGVFVESEVRVIDDAAAEDEEPPVASLPDEPPGETEMSHEPEPLEGYGDDFESLAVTEPGDSPGAVDSDEEQDEAVSVVEENAAEATAPEPAQEDEPDAAVGVVLEYEEAVTDVVESTVEATAPEPETSQESVVEATVSDPETPRESEPEAVEAAADLPPEEPDEASEPFLVENGFIPLVRDARGAWRPGKGFSRSELREAGLSLAEAARLHIRIDKRRRNAHPMNVAALEKAKSGV